jgi:carbon-monoxide dehydrogenase large subunit
MWASRRIGRPVKWIPSRSEAIMGDTHGRDQVVHGEMALDANGGVLAIRASAVHAIGAYTSGTLAPIEMSMRLIPSLYDVQTFYLESRGVLTHTAAMSSYRGAGRPEAAALVERLLERGVAADGSAAPAPHDPARAITQNRQPGKCCDTGCTVPGTPMMVDLPTVEATLPSKRVGAKP